LNTIWCEQHAIESGLPDKDVKTMCIKYAELERNLGEIDRARAIYIHASQMADPRSDAEFWVKWNDFEVQHGNEDTFREMLRIKRSVSASYSQVYHYLKMSNLSQAVCCFLSQYICRGQACISFFLMDSGSHLSSGKCSLVSVI